MRDPALWRRIKDAELVGPSDLDLVEEAMQSLRWRRPRAEVVTEEYRRFLYLACIARGEIAAPHHVDELWGIHITAGANYAQVIGRGPRYAALPRPALPASRGEQYAERYDSTRACYRQEFGSEPPPGVWPDPSKRYTLRFPILAFLGMPLLSASCVGALEGGRSDTASAGMVLGAALMAAPFALPRKLSRRGMTAEDARRRMRRLWEFGESGGDGGGGDGGGGGGE
jgi:hypothetical protein